MFCKKCGKELKEGQKFCPQCGTPFTIANDGTANAKVNHAVNNDGSNESAPEKEKNKVDTHTSNSKKVEEISEPKLELVQPKVEVEATGDNPDNIPLNEEEVKKYGNLKKGLKWGGLVMAIFLGCGSLSDFSWFSFLLYVVLCYLVYNSFFGKEEGKTLADFNLLKLKTFVCMGLCLILFMCGPRAETQSSLESSSSSFSGFEASPTSSKSNNSQEEKILLEMARIREEIKSVLPKVETLYNAHQQHMAQGLPYGSSPAWGKWQDCNRKIDDLWNKYINLARKLDDNEAIIKEAQESKRTMDQTIMDMFGPHY